MKIWTTKTLADTFFPDGKFALEARLQRDVQNSFLQDAISGDMALMDLPEEYIEFLAAAKAKGIFGPFIFISPEPTIIDEQLKRYRALVLDTKKNEISEIREVVNFIAERYSERDIRTFFGQGTAGEMPTNEFKAFHAGEQIKEKDPSRIKQVLEYILRADIPVIISASILEDGDPVTARGLSHIEAFNDTDIVLRRFKPLVFPDVVRENAQIKLVLSHHSENFDAVSNVLRAGSDELHITVPGTLLAEKRKSIRIEPSRKDPVVLYIMRKDEPTTACRVLDISIGGLCFESGIELIKDGIYVFAVALPRAGIALSYGKILYRHSVASFYRYGVQLNIHPGDVERIAHYIMGREKEIAELLKNYITQTT